MSRSATSAEVELVAIGAIRVGVRRRRKLGRLQGLAHSIEEHGLLHPILVRNGNELVAGQRRLEACRSLGWTRIPVRRVDRMTDDELRAIELEENTERLALLDFEASKGRLAEIRQAEAEAKQQEVELRSHSDRKGRGRPREAGSERDVAARTGLSKTGVRKVEQHVALAEQYPFMQKPEWRQYNVLEAGAKMEKLPPKDRPAVAVLLDQPAIPPKRAIEILDNLGGMPGAARQRIFEMAKSPDQHTRGNALAAAAQLPPTPDPGLLLLLEAERTLRKAAKETRVERARGRIEQLATTTHDLADLIRTDQQEEDA